jgi:hypothetical protein
MQYILLYPALVVGVLLVAMLIAGVGVELWHDLPHPHLSHLRLGHHH